MIVARITAPKAKLATARSLSPASACERSPTDSHGRCRTRLQEQWSQKLPGSKKLGYTLVPALANEVGSLGERHRHLVAVLDLVPVESFVHYNHGGVGRPPGDRNAMARAFVAKAVWDIPTTRGLIDRLMCDPTLRRLCGWSRVSEVPSACTRRWSAPLLTARSSGTFAGIPRRSRRGKGRRRSRSPAQARNNGIRSLLQNY